MSKIIASAAIRGAHKLVERAEEALARAIEEKGKDGGCLTLLEGYDPQTYGKLLLSTKLGTSSTKSAVVVDGVMTSTARKR